MIYGERWISDRVRQRALVVQLTLLLSALMTVWIPYHDALSLFLFLNLILYGTFVQSRGSLTQAMIGDFSGGLAARLASL